MMAETNSMKNEREADETKHLGETEEIAERWQKVKKLFEAATALAGTKREKFLRKACGADRALRLEVEKLIASFEDSDTFLERPAPADSKYYFQFERSFIDYAADKEAMSNMAERLRGGQPWSVFSLSCSPNLAAAGSDLSSKESSK